MRFHVPIEAPLHRQGKKLFGKDTATPRRYAWLQHYMERSSRTQRKDWINFDGARVIQTEGRCTKRQFLDSWKHQPLNPTLPIVYLGELVLTWCRRLGCKKHLVKHGEHKEQHSSFFSSALPISRHVPCASVICTIYVHGLRNQGQKQCKNKNSGKNNGAEGDITKKSHYFIAS